MSTKTEIPDYELAAQELKTLFGSLPGFQSLRVDPVGSDPSDILKAKIWTDEDTGQKHGWKHRRWIVRVRGVSFDYKTGTGIKHRPLGREIIASACRDYQGAADCRNYEDFADNCGYDHDSRKGEAIYRACLALGDKLRQVGLTRHQIETIAAISARL